MAEAFIQYILGGGLVIAIVSLVVTRAVNRRFDMMEQRRENQIRLEKFLLTKTDELAELVELMALKLHEKGVINGDLEETRQRYLSSDREYEDWLREMLSRQLK